MSRFPTTPAAKKDAAAPAQTLQPAAASWREFLDLLATTEVPADFLTEADRQQAPHLRDPLVGEDSR
ncbi:MAG: hypothetical protein ACOY5G_10460 [Pseudomonadota bacterium]